ncbi:MAG: PaaI family thioesterase [Firmicutes bacterium]|nr:PaaI family thioesterase [Bacillota bacterium]
MNIEEKVQEIVSNVRHNGGGMLSNMLEPEYLSCDPVKKQTRIRYKRFKWEENGRGEVHGGVISAMMDTAMGVTAMAFLDHDVSTADMSISFVRPFAGRAFVIESEVIHLGQRIVRLTARAFDEETGKLLASGTTNFMPVSYEKHKGILGV